MLDEQIPVLYRARPRGTLPPYQRQVHDLTLGEARDNATYWRTAADVDTKGYRSLRASAMAAYWQSIADAHTRKAGT